MVPRQNDSKSVLLAMLAVAFLASAGILVKLSALSPINTGFYRVLFSIPLFFPVAYKRAAKLKPKDVALLLLAGVFLAGDMALWNMSFNYTTVANANLLGNLTPFTVIPVSYFLFKENLPKKFWFGALLTIGGLVVLMGSKVSPSLDNYFGDFLAVATSVFYAGFLLIAYRLRDRIDSSVIMFVSAFGAALTLGLIGFAFEGPQFPSSWAELWPILGLTLFVQIIGHNLLTHCQGQVSVTLSCIICLSQPVWASIYAYLIWAEKISAGEAIGMGIVMAGVFFVKRQYSK